MLVLQSMAGSTVLKLLIYCYHTSGTLCHDTSQTVYWLARVKEKAWFSCNFRKFFVNFAQCYN